MNRILMAAAAVLVASAPLAFAASSANLSAPALAMEHCSSLDQQSPETQFKSEGARQSAEDTAMSLCREDRHKNGGKQADGEVRAGHAAAPRG